jgi:hypothetical protein
LTETWWHGAVLEALRALGGERVALIDICDRVKGRPEEDWTLPPDLALAVSQLDYRHFVSSELTTLQRQGLVIEDGVGRYSLVRSRVRS